jgi:hypothetical protein
MAASSCYVQLNGGLGNQLFEIATGYAHCRRNGLTLRLSHRTNCKRGTYWDSFLERCAGFQATPPAGTVRLWREPHFHWAPIPPEARALSGYFQSSRYFNDVSGEIRELFIPSTAIQEAVQERWGELLTEESKARSVVVHVRRTDYLTSAAYHVVTTPEYYDRAIMEMRRRMPEARLVVFSDDLAWCRAQKFFPDDTVFVDEPDDCRALWLMAQFRHYIIANSSFSWWATWLGAEPTLTVIAPDRWFGPTGPQDWQDIYEPHWIRLGMGVL